ncbi:MAG: DNA primase small subunit domain-containing protein, partial [Candidatus Micrarchaeota archaeon]
GRPMAKKNWLGADLIFDLDAEPDKIAPFITLSSLDVVREKTINLIEEFLLPDFGISKNELQINFSGSRGYHVRVYKKEIQKLGRGERREIVDYIEGNGLDFNDFFAEEPIPGRRFARILGPTPSMGGFKGKIARRVINMLKNPSTASSISPKLKNLKNAEKMIKGINNGKWSDVPITHAMQQFREIFEQTKFRLSSQVSADANVTIDTSKILRLPDSIHGGSGLIAKTVSPSSLPTFSPLSNALAFSPTKTAKIKAIRTIPAQEFANQTFDEIKKESIAEVPECYAVYLICKKTALPLKD